MKNNLTIPMLGAALVAGVIFTSSASANVVAGVEVGPNAQGFTILATQLYESAVSGTTQTLYGAGQVTAINANTSFIGGGQQLNYIFQTTNTYFSATQTVFDGGYLRFYIGDANTFTTALNEANLTGVPSTFNDIIKGGTANADGITNLWLDLNFKSIENPPAFTGLTPGNQGAIFGTGTGFSGNNFSGSGLGNLDVIGGLALSVFNSNFFDVTLPGGAAGKADFNFASSFSLTNPAAGTNNLPVFGSTTFSARPVFVPEPMPVTLLGVGIFAALGAMRMRAKA